jgi:hypothetical protein
MAKFQTSGLDEMVAKLQNAGGLDDKLVNEIMNAAGEIMVTEIKKRVAQSGFATEDYVKSIKPTRIRKNKYGEPYIQVTAEGNNKHGERRAAVLFILNYGRGPEYGRITGTYFWTRGSQEAAKQVDKELEELLTQKLKERGLL